MIHSFLMIGQSNMAGRGFIGDVEPIKNSRLYVLRNGRWQPMCVPVNYDRPFSGICLAESFADAYAEESEVQTGLIPCADGNTSLDDWRQGGLLFDHAVFQAKLAMRTSEIKGILWHQGEADCKSDRYPLYKEKFLAIMRAFRHELHLERVPFLLGGLGDFLNECPLDPQLANYVHINQTLCQIASEEPFTGFVSAKGLSSNPDLLHFSAKALREFGLRYYEVFRKTE